jgi:hypothetical protein
MEMKLYSKVSNHIKELDKTKFFKRKLRSFLLQHAFYLVKEYVMSNVADISLSAKGELSCGLYIVGVDVLM